MRMSQVRIWEEAVVIPTYEVGAADKNPMFLEKRVYQGSSGKIYPYPTTEKISRQRSPSLQSNAKITPPVVAIPFPPLKCR